MKSNFYDESIETMRGIAKGAKDREYSYLNIIQLIWIAFDFDNDNRIRYFMHNWIVDKEREIDE